MAGTLVRKVSLQITADDADAEAKIDAIKVKADELREMYPELTPRINTAEAQAKLAVLRDELKATAEAAGEAGAEMSAAGDEAAVAGDKMEESGGKGELAAKGWEVAKYAFLGVGAGLAYGVVKAAGFEQAMLRVHTLAGVSRKQLGSLGDQVLQLAGQVGQNPDSLAESLYHVASNMASMGATGPQMINAVKVAAEGASVGGANLVDVTNALGAAIASGIPGVQNYQSAMGMLNATVGAGDMQMQDLAEAMGTGFLSNVKIYGSTLNDVGAILATFGDNNIRGAHAGTQLRMSVQSLAVQAATAAPYLKELGLSAGELGQYQSVHGTVATINLLVQKLHEAGIASTDTGNIVTQLFGKKAGAGIAVLIDQVDRLNSKQKVLAEGAGSFSKEWAEQSKSPQQQLKDLEAGSEALAISLGIKLLPAATKTLSMLNGFIQGLQHGSLAALGFAGVIGAVLGGLALKKLEDGLKGAVEGIEGLGKGVKNTAGAMKDFSAGFGDAGKAADDATGAWGTFGGKVSSVLGGIKSMAQQAAVRLGLMKAATEEVTVATEEETGAQEGLDVAMDANPVGLIIMAIGLLVIAFVELWKHSAAFRDFWKAAWKDVQDVALAAWHFIDGSLIKPLEKGADQLTSFIKSHWKLLAEILGTMLLGPVGFLIAFIATHWAEFRRLTSEVVDDVTGFFRSLPGRVMGAIAALPGLLFAAGQHMISSLISGAGSMVSSGMSQLAAWGHDLINAIGSPFGIHFSEPSEATQMIKAGQKATLGLARGMTSETAAARAAALAVGRAAGIGTTASAGAGGRAGVLQIEWVGGGGADQQFLTWLKKNIRIRGGQASVIGS